MKSANAGSWDNTVRSRAGRIEGTRFTSPLTGNSASGVPVGKSQSVIPVAQDVARKRPVWSIASADVSLDNGPGSRTSERHSV